MHHRIALVVATAVLICTHHAIAQDSTATIVGTVVDTTTDLPIADVTIYVDNQDFADTTGNSGEFSVGGLLGGAHVALLMCDGYAPNTVQFSLPEGLVGEVDVGVVPLSPGPPPKAFLAGTVVDSRTGQPVFGVDVALNGQTGGATNVAGGFRVEDVAVEWGTNVLVFRRVGYAPMEAELLVTQQQTDVNLDVSLVLSAIPLAEVVVEGERATHSVGLTEQFYERRRIGFGTFFDEHELEKIRPLVVTDVLRRVIGVRIEQDFTGRSLVRFSRTLTWGDCPPILFLNGARVSGMDDINWLITPELLLGIEVYQGAQIPTEFNQTGAACGVVVIWTK